MGYVSSVCNPITFSCPSFSSARAAVKAVGSTTDNAFSSSTLTTFCARGRKEGRPSTRDTLRKTNHIKGKLLPSSAALDDLIRFVQRVSLIPPATPYGREYVYGAG